MRMADTKIYTMLQYIWDNRVNLSGARYTHTEELVCGNWADHNNDIYSYLIKILLNSNTPQQDWRGLLYLWNAPLNIPLSHFWYPLKSHSENIPASFLGLTVSDEETARTVCGNWADHNNDIYSYLIKILLNCRRRLCCSMSFCVLRSILWETRPQARWKLSVY